MFDGRRVALFVLGFGLMSACGRPDRDEAPVADAGAAQVGSAKQQLRTNPEVSQFAVYAANSLSLMDRAAVHGGDVGAQLATSGPFLVSGYHAALSSDARIDTDHDLLADRVLLKDRATVGDVEATTLTNQFGTYLHQYPLPSMPIMPSAAPSTPGATSFSVASGQTRSMTAGAYGAVSVQGTLTLAGGTYDFASLALGNDARLQVLATSQVHIAGRLATGDRARIEPSGSSLTAKDVRLEVSGVNGSTGGITASPKAASFGNDTVLRALVLVPNGTLQTGHRTNTTGALFGRDVTVNLDAVVTFEDGFAGTTCGPCDDGNPCTEDSCSGGSCSHAPAASGSACGDPDSCSGAATCDGAGSCVPGAPVSVDDGNPCTIDACTPGTGVIHTPASAGSSCSDGNVCNGDELCDGAGACLAGIGPSLDDGNPCTVDVCDPILGVVHTPAEAGTSCADADACNGAETCDGAGACRPAAALSCASESPCMTASCEPSIGCVFTPVAVGVACDSDLDQCNGVSTCDGAGACAPGVPPSCTSSDPCKVASCEPTTGCVLAQAPPGTPGCVPVLEPPPLDPTLAARMQDVAAFLYSGSSPVQTGVAPGTITAERVAIVRGRVLDADGTMPKAGATVRVVGHPELGQTITRADGTYDLAVNGGTTYAVEIRATGYLPVQRRVTVGWRAWGIVDDVVLTHVQASPDLFVSGSAAPQLVRGLVTPAGEDADGARRAVILFPEGTRLTNYAVPDGTPLEVQVTEYTRGSQGLQRMPGELPTAVGYTYAVELGIPAASAAGVRDVEFDRDVAIYVDNFTHYPVGEPVPLGYYDRDKSAWLAHRSGRIIKVLDTAGGVATVDVTGDGVADTGAALDDLGITTSELETLASEYAAGAELWRMTVRHFSPWDANWGFGFPPGAAPPPPPDPRDDDHGDPCRRAGSIIGCETRTLGETLPIVGTPFALHYQSDRNAGFLHELTFPIAAATLPSPLPLRAIVQVDVAGRRYEFAVTSLTPNQRFTWRWDGLDAYGRHVTSATLARIRVGYEYRGVTNSTGSFGGTGGATISGDRAARSLSLWKESFTVLRHADAKPLGFGGWTLDAHHFADLEALTLYRGDGRRRRFGLDSSAVVELAAGGGPYTFYDTRNTDGPATAASFESISDIATAGDGSLYLVTGGYTSVGGRVQRVTPDGNITTLAGMPPAAPFVDGAPALHAQVYPTSIALGVNGTVYFAETARHRVWKITPDGTLRLVAGTGSPTCPLADCGDGGDAREAQLAQPRGVAVAPDGTVFIADAAHQRVRRVGPEGTISTYVRITNYAEWPTGLSLRSDGTLFVREDNQWLIRVDPSGKSSYTAWIPSWWGGGSFYGGLLARDDDSFLIANYNKVLLRQADGAIQRIAGQGVVGQDTPYGYSGDGGPAIRALFGQAAPIAESPSGDIFVAVNDAYRIRRIRPSPFGSANGSTLRVPSEDGSEIYETDAAGRHARTLSGLKGTPLYTFGFDPTTNELSSIADSAGNVTTIARSGGAITITAPHGQVTTLGLDAHGYLASLTNPNGETTQLAHTTSGLLTDLVDPRGGAHRFEYDAVGRLTKDVDATPGSPGTRLAKSSDVNGWTVDITSAADRVTRHRVDRKGSFDGAIRDRRTITQGGSLSTVIDTYVDESKRSVLPDGTKFSVLETAADPRWGVSASYDKTTRTEVGHPTTTHSMTRTESRTATLAVPGDPFTVSAQTITSTLSGAGLPNATTTNVYAAGPPATWTTTSPAGRQIRQTLDGLERVTQLAVLGTDPVALLPVSYHYDANGRIDQVTRGSRVFGVTYDPATGWVESTTDPAGLGVSYSSRDGNGRPLAINLPGGRALAMSYDQAGSVISVAPPNKPAHGFSRDPNGRLSAYAPPDLGFTLKDTTYARDDDGLLLQRAQPAMPSTFSYDALGRLEHAADAVTKAFAYDPQGRLASVTTSDGVTLTNTYDGALLAQQAVSGPFSHALSKTYDNFLRVSSWSVDGEGASLTYDGDGLVTAAGGMSVTRGNTGLVKTTSVGAITDAYSYNPYGEVTGHIVTGSATSYAATYARDLAGRIETKTETIGGVTHSERYTYDAAGRLWQVFVDGASTPYREWTYDANGNRADGTYDAQDRQLTHEGFSFAYGPNGELTTKTDDATHAETLYGYDPNGNLRTVTRPPPLAPIEYVIDGQNRRIGKKVGGALVQGFVYDGSRVVAELDGTGAVVARFVYAMGGHSPDLMLKAGTAYRLVKDHLGSIRLVVDASTGAVAQRMDFDEWGAVTADTAPGLQPFGFAAGLWDGETNLVRFGARDYDAATGRWTTKDPARFAGGLNLYAYCYDDAINYLDPWGRRGVPPVPAVGGAVGTGAGLGAAGPWAGLVAASGAIIGWAVWDIMNQIDDFQHPTVVGADPGPGSDPGGDNGGGFGPPGPPPDPGGGDGGDDCKRKATPWELKDACIDAHARKKEIVGKRGSRYDICKCDSGGFALKRLGCRGPIIERL